MADKGRVFAAVIVLVVVATLAIALSWVSGRERQALAESARLDERAQSMRPDAPRKGLTVRFDVQSEENLKPEAEFPPGDYHTDGWPPEGLVPAGAVR